MPVTLDLMEYATDVLIQEAYPTNGHHAITFVATAELDTDQKKFGASSALLDGNSDALSIPNSADFTLGTENFTFNLQVRFAEGFSSPIFYGQRIDATNQWYLWLDMATNKLIFLWVNGGTTKANFTCPWTPVHSTWYHIEVARSGSTCYMFIEGDSKTVTEVTAFGSLDDIDASLGIGSNLVSNWTAGHIDEPRISKGIARHTSSFSAPTAPYQTDQYTVLLSHLDGADEAVATIDSSRLEAYSESSIVKQGSRSLKGFAKTTDSLGDTLTRTVDPTIDLSDQNAIEFWIRTVRTGQNIKIGIHDAGGVTTEITPNILAANTWQKVVWNISGVPNGNKDAIDQIIITIVNAD